MTKKQLDNINRIMRQARSRYYSDLKYDSRGASYTPGVIDKFSHLRLDRLNDCRFKTMDTFTRYEKSRRAAIVGPTGQLP